ncbi:hypothetical protein PCE1_004080 [Barthelona sp. PCE]
MSMSLTQTRRKRRTELTSEQQTEIREAFTLFDVDKTNRLGYHELKVAMRALGLETSKPEVLRILEEYGEEGMIDFSAFSNVMGEKIVQRDPVEEIRTAFNLIDVQGNGKISFTDLKRTCRELNEPVDEAELEAMISEFSSDPDGKFVTFDDFLRIMTSQLP